MITQLEKVQSRKSPAQDAYNVPHGRARRRSDHADATRQHRQRLLARFVEKPFDFQALLELLKRKLQRAQPRRLDVLDVNLIFAARLIHADRSAHNQLQPVLGPEFQPHGLRPEADALHRRLGILEGEI